MAATLGRRGSGFQRDVTNAAVTGMRRGSGRRAVPPTAALAVPPSPTIAAVNQVSDAAIQRIVPFIAFMGVLALRGSMPPDGALGFDERWLYALTLPVVGGLLAWWWRGYGELARSQWPPADELALAVAVGLLVFVAWINLDRPWMQLGEPSATFLPMDGAGAPVWPLIAVRWLGAALVVPLMEELFWRSFLMRWVDATDFEAIDPRHVSARAVVISTGCFMLAHPLWLAAIVAGAAYAWLYWRGGRLWSAVVAHAVTNGALGVWVVATRQWQFW